MSTAPASADGARRAHFERIAGEVYEPLQRYLRRRAGAADSADVLAETLLVLWRRLDDVPPEALAWCYGVARRQLANQVRGDRRRLRLVERSAAQPPSTMESGDPQEAVEQLDFELSAAVAALSEAEAEIVRLWAWEQLEPREIAVALDLTTNAVSVALSRAKRKLAAHLTEPSAAQRQVRVVGGHLHDRGTTEHGGDDR